MAGLSDMEELIATVEDKEVANYLREALACYGTTAYRACIVLTHIALFDGLRRKIRALSPVNSVAKKISDEIEPLAVGQKVFETPLIHKLRAAGVFTELEAQRLEQLNDHRNKAAHPSGHVVTAEEARFVFSETIQKYLSQPIRETTYVVENIISRISEKNFFPSRNMNDTVAIVEQETSSMDKLATNFLVTKLVEALSDASDITRKNVISFFLALANRSSDEDRSILAKKLIEPKCSDDNQAELMSSLINSDPQLFMVVNAATKLRLRTLIIKNAKSVGSDAPYSVLRSPVSLLARCIKALGEELVLKELKVLVDWTVEQAPTSPGFVKACIGTKEIFPRLFEAYLSRASSSQWDDSNPLARGISELDQILEDAVSDEQALELLAAFVKGSEWGGSGAMELTSSNFGTLPKLKIKALSFAMHQKSLADGMLSRLEVKATRSQFIEVYLTKE